MEIRVTKPFLHGGNRVEPDDVIDLPVADAAYVIGLGKAVAIEAPQESAEKRAPKKPKAK